MLSISANSLAEVAVIVNPANSNVLSESDVSRAFLGKLKKFADGQAIEAVNSAAGNAVRIEFQQKALKNQPRKSRLTGPSVCFRARQATKRTQHRPRHY